MSKHILLVSDNGGPDHELEHALRKLAEGFEVECAATREEIAALPQPCLILLDLMLSSEAAPEVLSWLRTEPLYQHVPVFVFGSEIGKRAFGDAFRLGATSCFLVESRGQIEPIADGIVTYASLLAAPAYGAC